MTARLASRDDRSALSVDVRGPRFGAAVTTVVLGMAVVVQGTVGVALVWWQWATFAVAAFAGLRWSPYGTLFRILRRRRRWGSAPATEPEGPPRFAQLCGFVVTSVALSLLTTGATTAGWVAVGVVLVLSSLLAATGLCIGCELYLVGRRRRSRGGRV